MKNTAKTSIKDVTFGSNVRIGDFVNLYLCEIGDNTKIGAFVEIQKGAKIGNNVKVSTHTFICEGVTIEDDVFVGHNVSFINDKHPRATLDGKLKTDDDWQCIPTLVKHGASIGTGSTILCGVTIGENAVVGAGSVVTKDVPASSVVAGVPAKFLKTVHPEGRSPLNNVAAAGVPFLNLKAQYLAIKDEINEALARVLDSCSFVLGEEVRSFESEFAQYCSSRYGVAVNSGTSALHLALLASGVGPGDEVITVPFTFVATVAAILYTGARPVLVDVDPDFLTMDPERIEKAISPRTKAILPVHLYGQPADMDPIMEIAEKHGLIVIEDAAQAHGAEYKGQRVGGIGHMGCFSFYPGKNLGAYGEGGIVVTNDQEYARTISMLRDWGQESKYNHVLKGYNYRMEGFQGAVLRVKLRHLEKWTEARRQCAQLYAKHLEGAHVTTPPVRQESRHVYHVYAVRHPKRDDLQVKLTSKGIQTGIHYPVPVHLQPAYAELAHKKGDFPASEQAADQVLSLPMFPELSENQIKTVSMAVHQITEEN